MALAHYEELSEEISNKILRERASGSCKKVGFADKDAVRRRNNPHDTSNILRPAFVRDIDKIMNCPYYNRYADKTQVFSFYRNDDITRRGQHVQYVSRIARTVGSALGLNCDLIEAIALGHDIGHAPFGHAGERFLDGIYREKTGRRFSHNIQSVRVLDKIFPLNISLQTLCGIAAHDGEMEQDEYRPQPIWDFDEFDAMIESCERDAANVKKLVPSTLEGCVVRISDIIAYLGKDRQDAERIKLVGADAFQSGAIGAANSEIINNLTVNIIENSYGKDYIKLDKEHFDALKRAKDEDYRLIYRNEEVERDFIEKIKPMTEEIYNKLLSDLENGVRSSPVYRHHIDYLNKPYYKRDAPYEETEKNLIVVDYIASMTDDYFIDLYSHLFPKGRYAVKFRTYFN